MRKNAATLRPDGEATRRALIEAAGTLAAERGWDVVTARDVCEKAGVSPSSVNYWFGSREALYREVLERIPAAILPDESMELATSSGPSDALRNIIGYLIAQAGDPAGWEMRLWAREFFSTPGKEFLALAKEKSRKRIGLMRRVMSSFLGCDADDPEVDAAIVCTMAPCLFSLSVPIDLKRIMFPALAAGGGRFRSAMTEHLMGALEERRRRMAEHRAGAGGITGEK